MKIVNALIVFQIVCMTFYLIISTAWGKEPKPEKIVIEAQGKHEVCMKLKEQEVLTYMFSASDKLSFNLHYHTKEDIFYPVSKHMSSAEKGVFIATEDHGYCLMWSNPGSHAIQLSVEHSTE